jgi:hypothetical protein
MALARKKYYIKQGPGNVERLTGFFARVIYKPILIGPFHLISAPPPLLRVRVRHPMGPVVQRWISANPVFKFNPLFYFAYFCMNINFKMSEKKTYIDPDMVCEEIFLNL